MTEDETKRTFRRSFAKLFGVTHRTADRYWQATDNLKPNYRNSLARNLAYAADYGQDSVRTRNKRKISK